MLSQVSFFYVWIIPLIFLWLHDAGMSDVSSPTLGFSNGLTLLRQITSPTIGEDGHIYACIGDIAYAYNMDGTVAWSVGLNDTCHFRVPPVIDQNGRIFVAVNNKVLHVAYSQESQIISVSYLYNGTSLDGSMLGSEPITGLALTRNDTSILINAGVAGLYAIDIDGRPLWSTNGDFKSREVVFPSETFCSTEDRTCFFHFSPAVDHCDESIYIVNNNGWLYAIDGWDHHVKWRFNVETLGKTSVAGVTAGNNGRVYVAAVTGNLYTLDAYTGQLIWNVTIGPLTNQTCFPKVDSRGQVLLGSLDGFLYVISSDGGSTRRFLKYWASDSVISSCPYIDCATREIFVAQVNLHMKTMIASQVSYVTVKGVTLFALDQSTAEVLHSEYYPGDEMVANEDAILDTSLLLAVFASNQSDGKICSSYGAYRGWKCAVLVDDYVEGYIGGSIQPFYIALPICFLLIGVLILSWFLLRKRYTHYHRQPLQQRSLVKSVLPDLQMLYHRRAVYEQRLSRLALLCKRNPDSESLKNEHKKALEDFTTNEWFLSRFSCRNPLQDREPLLQERNVRFPSIGNITNRSSDLGHAAFAGSFDNVASSYGIVENEENAFHSYSLLNRSTDSVESGHSNNQSSIRRTSANPLFGGSLYLDGVTMSELNTKEVLPQDVLSLGDASSASPEMSPSEQYEPVPYFDLEENFRDEGPDYGIVWVEDAVTNTEDIFNANVSAGMPDKDNEERYAETHENITTDEEEDCGSSSKDGHITNAGLNSFHLPHTSAYLELDEKEAKEYRNMNEMQHTLDVSSETGDNLETEHDDILSSVDFGHHSENEKKHTEGRAREQGLSDISSSSFSFDGNTRDTEDNIETEHEDFLRSFDFGHHIENGRLENETKGQHTEGLARQYGLSDISSSSFSFDGNDTRDTEDNIETAHDDFLSSVDYGHHKENGRFENETESDYTGSLARDRQTSTSELSFMNQSSFSFEGNGTRDTEDNLGTEHDDFLSSVDYGHHKENGRFENETEREYTEGLARDRQTSTSELSFMNQRSFSFDGNDTRDTEDNLGTEHDDFLSSVDYGHHNENGRFENETESEYTEGYTEGLARDRQTSTSELSFMNQRSFSFDGNDTRDTEDNLGTEHDDFFSSVDYARDRQTSTSVARDRQTSTSELSFMNQRTSNIRDESEELESLSNSSDTSSNTSASNASYQSTTGTAATTTISGQVSDSDSSYESEDNDSDTDEESDSRVPWQSTCHHSRPHVGFNT